jgi:enterochelin esterase-like enzyme
MFTETASDYADRQIVINSINLGFPKKVDIFLPPGHQENNSGGYHLLLLNDGQDGQALQLRQTLQRLHQKGNIYPLVVAAIHATNRIQEYGTAGVPDYAMRGSMAKQYTSFLTDELLPQLQKQYRAGFQPNQTAIAGCSLGGLSAFDILWNRPDKFGKVGVFSGSFWWRRHSENDDLASIDRIMHDIVRKSSRREGLKFWFEAGTEDETADRNNNGIIDAIEDTLDLIAELAIKGYHTIHDIKYVEVQGGKHNQKTWGKVMPDFLLWAFGK